MPTAVSIAPSTAASSTIVVPMPRGFTCAIRVAPDGAGWRFGFLLAGPQEEYGRAESSATIERERGVPFDTRAAAFAGAMGVARIFFDRADAPGRDKALEALARGRKELRP